MSRPSESVSTKSGPLRALGVQVPGVRVASLCLQRFYHSERGPGTSGCPGVRIGPKGRERKFTRSLQGWGRRNDFGENGPYGRQERKTGVCRTVRKSVPVGVPVSWTRQSVPGYVSS